MNEKDFITREEHKEFAARIDAENERQNKRLSDLESTVKEIGKLTTSVEKMAVSMNGMVEEQKRQGARLDEIEKKPAKRWDTVISAILTGIVGILIGLISAGIIH